MDVVHERGSSAEGSLQRSDSDDSYNDVESQEEEDFYMDSQMGQAKALFKDSPVRLEAAGKTKRQEGRKKNIAAIFAQQIGSALQFDNQTEKNFTKDAEFTIQSDISFTQTEKATNKGKSSKGQKLRSRKSSSNKRNKNI